MYKNILVATDLGPNADQICEKAHHLARLTGAKLSVVHVLDVQLAYAFPYSWPEDFVAGLLEEVTKQIMRIGELYQIAKDDQYIYEGIPKVKILEVADEVGADCLVIGSHQHHGLQGVLGSNTTAILRHAHFDVLTVFPEEA
jgi:universal stress protein A